MGCWGGVLRRGRTKVNELRFYTVVVCMVTCPRMKQQRVMYKEKKTSKPNAKMITFLTNSNSWLPNKCILSYEKIQSTFSRFFHRTSYTTCLEPNILINQLKSSEFARQRSPSSRSTPVSKPLVQAAQRPMQFGPREHKGKFITVFIFLEGRINSLIHHHETMNKTSRLATKTQSENIFQQETASSTRRNSR